MHFSNSNSSDIFQEDRYATCQADDCGNTPKEAGFLSPPVHVACSMRYICIGSCMNVVNSLCSFIGSALPLDTTATAPPTYHVHRIRHSACRNHFKWTLDFKSATDFKLALNFKADSKRHSFSDWHSISSRPPRSILE